ncbi:hypothetical protein VNO77_24908 [Canavalia gladiata]|uniref:Uncharacterized protein n=1 Tax=Canavalia gladiata TaxID=3824 RepID=A0AAN9QAF0_CANGL
MDSPWEAKPCANNCGFFGIAENRNLCSKCYRDLRLQEKQESVSREAAAMRSFSAEPSAGQAKESKAVNRCGYCNKRVGLTGFICKCGTTFCGTHRYPEKHECSYDFKTSGRDAILKANPIVKADKIQKF